MQFITLKAVFEVYINKRRDRQFDSLFIEVSFEVKLYHGNPSGSQALLAFFNIKLHSCAFSEGLETVGLNA